MNTTHCKRETPHSYPGWKQFLTALFIAVMVMITTVPAFAAETTVDGENPSPEASASITDLNEEPVYEEEEPSDEDGSPEPVTEATPTSVSTAEELLEAIAHANENDVIEIDGYIQTPSELVLGRADCPITIRRATSESQLILGSALEGNVKVQNITFDGGNIQGFQPFIWTDSPNQIFEKCNIINCASDIGAALNITAGETIISDCHFSNNKGLMGAHLRVGSRNATIENCTFTGGYASSKGSVCICPLEKAFLIGCTVNGNTAEDRGGGIYVGSGELNIIGSKIYGNTADGNSDDITQDYWGRVFLADDYAALVELYKPDGMVPNRWTVDTYINPDMGPDTYHTDMVFSMSFADNEPVLPPVSVTLDRSELNLDVGEIAALTATISPEGGDWDIQWTSSNADIASVSESGLVTAHSPGTALITATTDEGASASCCVNVKASQNIPVETYTIVLEASPLEGGTVSGDGQYKEGAIATITAVANDGFYFLAWEENDVQISAEDSLTFTVSTNRNITAIFEPMPKSAYIIDVSPTQGGVVNGGGEYEEGASVIVDAVPDDGYRFLCWEENGVQISTQARYSFKAEADRTLIAVFELLPPPTTNQPNDSPHDSETTPSSQTSSGSKPQLDTAPVSSQNDFVLTNGKVVLTAPDDLFWEGYNIGCNDGTRSATRADLAQLVYSMMDNDSRKICVVDQLPFQDVKPGMWYEPAVKTMQSTGIMVGCGNGRFRPDRMLTWGELLTVFSRFVGDKPFTEYYAGEHWAKDSINRAFTLGWLEYTESFDPEGIVTAEEMADLIQAVFQWNNQFTNHPDLV